ncbi:hypothetical protein Agub_g5162 [Astrephomene gubernaculifera]|uniref:Core domain-containing protein n=1 Tax=Astrephomene gubernaculifera TaxID=47775 RepID=A0AAD3DP70_9CHLO|nr:hypothetical protein Agub_g5162 [Astrephomene gubernaculifera]
MLSRVFQAAALAERVLSGSLAQTTSHTVACTIVSSAALLAGQRHAFRTLPSVFAAYSSAAAQEASGLIIHPSAAARLRELAAEKPAGSPLALRIEVEGGGCSGFQYKFKLDEQPIKEDDIVFESEGGRVVCDVISLEFLRGATLEFEDTLMRAAFSISKNPNAEASCGCGSSFAAKLK